MKDFTTFLIIGEIRKLIKESGGERGGEKQLKDFINRAHHVSAKLEIKIEMFQVTQ